MRPPGRSIFGAVKDIAAAVLGFTLRPAQQQAVDAVAAGRDTLAVLPTGSGKSAIYQVGGLTRGGLTVVVSPLIALQRDQVRSMTGRGLRAVLLNSGQHHDDRSASLAALRDGAAGFVMLGPEQLANAESLAAIRSVTLVAIDEAHLVSEWGHDFRPEYLRLADVIDGFGRPPILALTATAAPPVQADITRQLRMRAPEVIVADFDRPNISLAVRRTRPGLPEAQAIDDRTVEVVLTHETPCLVYALTHARCADLADRLRLDAYAVEPYHAGLSTAKRTEVQDRFFAGTLDVVVATSAFGMGIDKPDVRTVVHAGVPGSLDEYYQEIGRAGRDGAPAGAVLVHDPRTVRIPRLLAARSRLPAASVHAVVDALESGVDTVPALMTAAGVSRPTVERVLDELRELGILTPTGTPPPSWPADTLTQLTDAGDRRQTILRSRIDAARAYAETTRCRRGELLGYFGEHYEVPCGTCDNDTAQPASSPAPHHAVPDGGVPVHHRLWGPGVLLSQDDHELIVAFESVGYRHLTAASLTNGLLTPD
jgi:ATP-dependent DNA helicase RecQ